MFVHQLALQLGMPVAKLLDEVSWSEMLDWITFFRQRDEKPKEDAVEVGKLSKEQMKAMFS